MPTGKGRSTWCAGHCCFFLHPICRCREGICTLCPCPCPSAVAERKGQKGLGLLASWWRCVISLDGGWLTGNPGKRGVCRPCCVLGRQGLILERGGGGVVVAGLEEEKRREKSKKKYTHSSARGARMAFLDVFLFWTSFLLQVLIGVVNGPGLLSCHHRGLGRHRQVVIARSSSPLFLGPGVSGVSGVSRRR